MRIYKSTTNVLILSIVFSIGFGCKYFSSNKIAEIPIETPVAAQTVITKEILKRRLGSKGIETVPERGAPAPLKPNPNTLHLRFSTSNSNFKLNQEEYGSFGELVNKLKEIFRYREENGVFREGTNEVYKTIILPAYDAYIADYNAKNIYIEDFEKLIDDLRKEGIDEIKLDINEENSPAALEKLVRVPERIDAPDDKTGSDASSASTKSNLKTISGGVLNGKATNLVKPAYPAAAKAVRASGAVNVQVTLDEQGNVISASAVSGHPLLRASAVQAARASKFTPTMLGENPVKVTGVIVYNFTPE
ncbi:MAG TPA: energy transducer TonB [Pyrinomonadaceae bacterium]|jgi:TonB family protein